MLSDAPCLEILHQEGFRQIGWLDYRLRLTAWWNPIAHLQLLVVEIGTAALLKGDKTYYLKSVSREGETWARDVGELHNYLENHFPELRVSFAHFRDLPAELAQAEARRRMVMDAPTQLIPSVVEIGELQRKLNHRKHQVQSTNDLLSISALGGDLLTGYAHQYGRTQQKEIGELEGQIQRQKERLGVLEHLQREYERKGSAAVYNFSVSSNLQVAENPARFRDALKAITKELVDQDRYQIKQKLQGGRLNIHVSEAEEPAISWIEQWMGGALSPRQLQRLGPDFENLRRACDHVIVIPDEAIVVDGHVRQGEKHLAARFLSTVLNRLDKTDSGGQKAPLDPESISPESMPLRVGVRTDETGRNLGSIALPLTQVVHGYISGTTGSGKSFLARAIVEEASQYKPLNILILDPRNQFVGLLVPENRPQILGQYSEFGMDANRARGFAFDYFAPGLPFANPLPTDLCSLAKGRSIISFKGVDDQQRCMLTGRILDAVFKAISAQESECPRLLIVVDEAQLLTRKKVDESAKGAAAQAERALDRIAREGRKYGATMVLLSQTIKDFSFELASLRQMTSTKIFLRNSDREIEYASDIIGDGRTLVQLPTGTAIIHNAAWGQHRIRVRPPYSKVYELPESQIRQLVGIGAERAVGISAEAEKLLAVVKEHGSPTQSPLNLSQAAELAGITSRRRLHELVAELEEEGVICTRQLPERGRPRVIELRNPSSAPLTPPTDTSRTKPDKID